MVVQARGSNNLPSIPNGASGVRNTRLDRVRSEAASADVLDADGCGAEIARHAEAVDAS